MAYPTDILALASAIGSQFLNLFHGGSVSHSDGTNEMLADLIAVETKLGTGASTATANTVLRGTGTGTTAFGQVVAADISASAAIAVTQLAAGTNKTLFTSNGSANSMSASPTVSGTLTAETKLGVGAASLGIRVIGQGLRATGASFLICSNSAANHGLLYVNNLSQGVGAIFSINGDHDFTELLSGSGTHFSVTAATGSKINVFSDTSNYYCQNGWAGDQTLQVVYVGVG
jgi:hypothetical protein